MTPAIQQLKKQNIPFALHQYQYDVNAVSFGEDAAKKLNITAARVFKTLILSTELQTLVVAIVPATHQINLKLLAKALNVKKVQMAEAKQVQASTGYVLGGVSPIGQKKALTTIIDKSSLNFTTIFVSGGKRGLEIELAVSALEQCIKAKLASII